MQSSPKLNKISVTILLRKFWKDTLLSFFSGIFVSILTISIPFLISFYFQKTFAINSYKISTLGVETKTQIYFTEHALTLFLVVILLRFILQFIQNFTAGLLGERSAKHLREILFDQQMNIAMSAYDQKGTGKYLFRYTGDLKSIQTLLNRGVIQFGIDMLFVLLSVVILGLLSPLLGLIYVIVSIAIGTIIIYLNKKLYSASSKRRDLKSVYVKFISQRLYGISTIKVFNKQVPEMKRLLSLSSELLTKGIEYQKILSLLFAITPLLSYGILLSVLFSISRISAYDLEPARLLTVVLIVLTMYPTLRRLLRVGSIWENGRVSMKKFNQVLATQTEDIIENPLEFQKGQILIKNLSFTYPGGVEVLSNISLKIEPQTITLIRGTYGSGKSTLSKLLLGSYKPSSGTITLDGQDISDADLKSLRKVISPVSDQFPLLGRTVFEAVSYSRKEEKKENVVKILTLLQEKLPEKSQMRLEDTIGEHGEKLSTSQRKILMYARALLTEKPILLIDEPFIGVPSETKKVIVDLLNEMEKKKTIILFSTGSLKKSSLHISKSVSL